MCKADVLIKPLRAPDNVFKRFRIVYISATLNIRLNPYTLNVCVCVVLFCFFVFWGVFLAVVWNKKRGILSVCMI